MTDIADRLTYFSPDEIPEVLKALTIAIGGDWDVIMAQVQAGTEAYTMSDAVHEICAHAHYTIDQLRLWADLLKATD
ncbi:hypothetical protein [Streptosporangium sandarakinum]|uniref:hypothetical protein n=1 Tax=Streptosporangium sandarakinum TaxID=1260955 RepID=UPI00378E65CA